MRTGRIVCMSAPLHRKADSSTTGRKRTFTPMHPGRRRPSQGTGKSLTEADKCGMVGLRFLVEQICMGCSVPGVSPGR